MQYATLPVMQIYFLYLEQEHLQSTFKQHDGVPKDSKRK